MHDKLLRVLKELRHRFNAYSPLDGPDMFDGLLVLAQQAGELQVELGLPRMLSCRRHAPPAPLRVSYRNIVGVYSELLCIDVYDPLTSKGRRTSLPQMEEYVTRHTIQMIADYLGRSITYVENRKADEEEKQKADEISTEWGVTLADVGQALGFSDEELRDFVNRFSRSKKITAEKLGKCPINARSQLYRLFEILKNLHDFSPLSNAEKERISKCLKPLQRKPKK